MIQLSTVSCSFIQYIQCVSCCPPPCAHTPPWLCVHALNHPAATSGIKKCYPVSHLLSASSCLVSLFIALTSVLTSSPISSASPCSSADLIAALPHSSFILHFLSEILCKKAKAGEDDHFLRCILLHGNHIGKIAWSKTFDFGRMSASRYTRNISTIQILLWVIEI